VACRHSGLSLRTVADQCPGVSRDLWGCVDRSDPPVVFRAYQARGTVRWLPDVRLSIELRTLAPAGA